MPGATAGRKRKEREGRANQHWRTGHGDERRGCEEN